MDLLDVFWQVLFLFENVHNFSCIEWFEMISSNFEHHTSQRVEENSNISRNFFSTQVILTILNIISWLENGLFTISHNNLGGCRLRSTEMGAKLK